MAGKGKKQRITVDGTVLKIEYPSIRKSLTVDVGQFSDEVKFDAMIHGFKQKYGDAESGGTAAEKYAMVQRIVEAHHAGAWDVAAGARDNSAIILEAVARVKGVPLEQVVAAADALGDEREATIKEWGTNLKIKAMIASIRAERATAAAEEAEADEDDIEIDLPE